MTKNASDRQDRVAARPAVRDDPREDRGAEHARVALEHAEEREELRRLVLRDHAGEERPAQRLRAALHHAHQHGEQRRTASRVRMK